MLPEFGPNIGALPRRLEFVRELEAFDGPILAEYRAEGGGTYLEKWCARDGATVRSLVVRAEQRALAEYLANRLSMLDLLLKTSDNVGFILDRQGATVCAVYLVHIPELPEKYLPSAAAMHDETLRPDWDTTPQSFLIDGEWDARLLARVERLYLELFSFSFFAAPNAGRRLPEGLGTFIYDGGFPVVHAFGMIRASVPAPGRAKSVGVSANSPGVLTIDAPADTAQVLIGGLMALPRGAAAYSNLYAWSKLKPSRLGEVPSSAHQDIHRLCSTLGLSTEAILPAWHRGVSDNAFSKQELLVAGKLLAAYFRRLRRLLEADPRVEFLGPRPEEPVSRIPVLDADDDESDDE